MSDYICSEQIHMGNFSGQSPQDLDNSLSVFQDSTVVVLPRRRKQSIRAKIWRLKTDEQEKELTQGTQ
jgi:hypothetical protein